VNDPDPELGRLLLHALVIGMSVAGVLLALAAPGPLWAKLAALAVLIASLAAVAIWWHGYRSGSGRR